MSDLADPKHLVISNGLELFGTMTGVVSDPNVLFPMRQSYRASQWIDPQDGDYALLCDVAPYVPPGMARHWAKPKTVFEVGGNMQPCHALQQDAAQFESLLAWLEGSNVLHIDAQVESEALRGLMRRIEQAKPHLEIHGLSTLSAGHIRRFNMKTGGRALMKRALGSEKVIPPQTHFATLEAALRWLQGAPQDTQYLLKPNSAIGGFGVIYCRAGVPLPDRQLEILRGRRRHVDTWKAIGTVDDGILLEVAVGDFPTNDSVTADFHVASNSVTMVGMSNQILKGRVAYRGISSAPEAAWTRARSEIQQMGERIGRTLGLLGYNGYLNIDVVVPNDPKQPNWLIEMNLRRSAPLNSHILLSRIHGVDWHKRFFVMGVEDEQIQNESISSQQLEELFINEGIMFQSNNGLGAIPMGVFNTHSHTRCSILLIAASGEDLDTLRGRVEEVIHRA